MITSPTGAAIRDILSVARRRYPGQPITVIPVPVQGEQAPAAIVKALRQAEDCGRFDALILARGGGSIEDLWAFNDEAVARAIFACSLPVVSAIGHEIDFTIADFVADVRAPTPSAAAELLVPNTLEILQQLRNRENLLEQSMLRKLQHLHQRLDSLSRRLRHPGEKLRHQAQQLDQLEIRLRQSVWLELSKRQERLQNLQRRLIRTTPAQRIQLLGRELAQLHKALKNAMESKLVQCRQNLSEQAHVLDSVSPLATLQRGFSALTSSTGELIKSHTQVSAGQILNARLSDGRLQCEVIASED